MTAPVKRVRSKQAGFVGAILAKGGDMTLYNRFIKAVDADPEMDQSKLIRIALKEYLDKQDEAHKNIQV